MKSNVDMNSDRNAWSLKTELKTERKYVNKMKIQIRTSKYGATDGGIGAMA
jgi:hypothetical protein